jgi:hypothetical protein
VAVDHDGQEQPPFPGSNIVRKHLTAVDPGLGGVMHWAMDDNYKKSLVSAAINMAMRNRTVQSQAIFQFASLKK